MLCMYKSVLTSDTQNELAEDMRQLSPMESDQTNRSAS